MTVKIIDHGLDKIVRETVELASLEVVAGILEKDAGKTYSDGTPVVDVAVYNEFGTATIPARPFMSATADAYLEKAGKVMAIQAQKVMAGGSAQEAADDLGWWYRGRINAHIDNGGWVPNSPATIKRKGRNQPLVDTKLLYNTLDHEVRKK